MTKAEILADPNSAWNTAADDEPIFVISARHPLFTGVARTFAFGSRSANATAEEVDAALQLARDGGDWREVHFPTPRKPVT